VALASSLACAQPAPIDALIGLELAAGAVRAGGLPVAWRDEGGVLLNSQSLVVADATAGASLPRLFIARRPGELLAQLCVRPRKLKVSGFPSPRSRRFLSA
jgi:hypothetical protein